MELNAEQIKKALECCLTTSEGDCSDCGYRGRTRSCFLTCTNCLIADALALINSQEQRIKELTEENKKLEYTLAGVMHSVDKWLDGKELEQDEVNRAITMRDKTLRLCEELDCMIDNLRDDISELTEENERLREENVNADILVQSYNNKVIAVNKTNTELEIICAKLRAEEKQSQILITTLHDKLDEGYAKFVDEERADTVRKMQERLTLEFNRLHKSNFMTTEVRQWIIDQIAKEMLEEGEK